MAWNLFEELSLARQLSFSEGTIKLLNYRLTMINSHYIANYIKEIEDDRELTAQFYKSIMESIIEAWGPIIMKEFKFGFHETTKWWVELVKLAGWGIPTWLYESPTSHSGRTTFKNSALLPFLKGKVKYPCDHLMRGCMAGGISAVYNTPIHVIEIECEALGAQTCRFVYDELPKLKEKYPDLVRQQIEPNYNI